MGTKTTPKGAEEEKADKVVKGFLPAQTSGQTQMPAASLGPGKQRCGSVYHFQTFKARDGLWIYKRVFNPSDTAKNICTLIILLRIDSNLQFLSSFCFWYANLMHHYFWWDTIK